MPSTGTRRKSAAATPKVDVLEDLEIKPEKAPRSTSKEVPVSKIVSETITDRLSATIAYSMSNNMIQTVGKDYAITPVEAYNIVHPASNIIVHYLPTTTIKTKLPGDVADNLEKMIVTFLEYTTRVLSMFVESQFNKRLQKEGLQLSRRVERSTPTQETREPQQTPVMSQDEIAELVGQRAMPIDDENIDVQVRPGRTGTNLADLVADGVIVGDLGQAY